VKWMAFGQVMHDVDEQYSGKSSVFATL
jgi:hypothetical protein